MRRESGKGNRIEPSGVTRIREGRGGRTDAVERSLVAEALALERPRETQLRHIASGADLAAAPRASRGVLEGWWERERERKRGAAVEEDDGGRAGEVGRGEGRFVYSRAVGLLKGPLCPPHFRYFYR